MILLGAGASVEAKVPGALAMTRSIAEHFRRDPYSQRHSRVLTFVIGGLLFQRGIHGSDPFDGTDVEELFNAVQLLAGRHTLEAAPFIGSWHAMVDEFDKRNPYPARLDRFQRSIYEGLARELVASLPQSPPHSEARAIDDKLERVTKAHVEALLSKRKAHIPSYETVSKAVPMKP